MKSVLLFLAGLLVGANIVYFVLVRPGVPAAPAAPTSEVASTKASTQPGVVGTDPIPNGNTRSSSEPTLPPRAAPFPATAPASQPGQKTTNALLIPVAGITAGQLDDTFNDARGGERRHEALDIMAARGTAVMAARDGKVEKLFNSKLGGLTIYQFDPTGTYAYYYAHLDRYAPGLAEGRQLRRGEVIGYVGSTGNASPDAPHLHFAIFVLGPEKQWWKGTAIDPYPLLVGN